MLRFGVTTSNCCENDATIEADRLSHRIWQACRSSPREPSHYYLMEASKGQRTSVPDETAESLILAARGGSRSAFERLVALCYEHLRTLARSELSGPLQTKLSGSDLVQDTLVEAERCFADFRGSTQQELVNWLRRILLNNRLFRLYRG